MPNWQIGESPVLPEGQDKYPATQKKMGRSLQRTLGFGDEVTTFRNYRTLCVPYVGFRKSASVLSCPKAGFFRVGSLAAHGLYMEPAMQVKKNENLKFARVLSCPKAGFLDGLAW